MDSGSLVIFVCGLNGTGKSTLSRALRAELGAIDTTLVEDAVVQGHNVVIEGVLADDLRHEWMSAARRAGGRVITVECTCSDADLHRQRVERRRKSGQSPITWEMTDANRKLYRPYSEPDVTADAVDSVEANVVKVLAAISQCDPGAASESG